MGKRVFPENHCYRPQPYFSVSLHVRMCASECVRTGVKFYTLCLRCTKKKKRKEKKLSFFPISDLILFSRLPLAFGCQAPTIGGLPIPKPVLSDSLPIWSFLQHFFIHAMVQPHKGAESEDACYELNAFIPPPIHTLKP